MSYEACPTCGAWSRVIIKKDWRAGLMGPWLSFFTGLLWGIAVPVVYLVYYYVKPAAIDTDFSRGLYRYIGQHVIPYTEQVPFSLSLYLTIALIVLAPLLWLIRWLQLIVRGDGFLAGLVWGPVRLLFLAPLLAAWFLIFWGAGYQRPPVEKRLGLVADKPTQDEIQRIEDSLLAIVQRDQPRSPEDRNIPRAVKSISTAMAQFVHETEGRPARVPQRVKATPPGFLLFNSTSGICSPFTLEANVDGAIPDTGFVYVAAHELAHTAGINREGEATLYGQIAGLRADDPFARYCVALDAYRDLAGDLGKDGYKAAMERLPQESRDELKHIHEVAASYNVKWFSQYSWKAYNKYLQTQGIKEGTRNYAQSTKLFVYAARKGYIRLDTTPAPAK